MVLTSGRAPMRISDGVMRSLGLPVAPRPHEARAGEDHDTWYIQEGERAVDRLARLQKQAKKLKTITADGDEELPEKAAYMSTSSFKAG